MKKGCREDSLGIIIPLKRDFVRMFQMLIRMLDY